jgi:hypothetical protein
VNVICFRLDFRLFYCKIAEKSSEIRMVLIYPLTFNRAELCESKGLDHPRHQYSQSSESKYGVEDRVIVGKFCSFVDGSVECLLHCLTHLDPLRESISEPLRTLTVMFSVHP